ncbi:uncharacterized protein LOC132272900 [Cornus florida]|uniref:uncharacterized protein LOC132272900 n=1 Tax=Cornus florida TaxID=4283 RepID=UPI00289922DE|nr:uncharacterized protein LOC132272900 [Cornus florida]
MKQHNQFNAITSVEDHTGQVKTQTDEIKKVFVDYYQDTPITDEKIKAVVMNFKPDKAPGPDGFPARFYQSFWSIVQPELINTSISEGRLTLSNTALKAKSTCCHTFFADDLLITCKASVSNARTLKHIFKIFGDAAGLHINYQKSSVIFSKFARRKRSILNMLQCKDDVFPFKYLGLPLSSTGFRKFHCNALIDKISKKLSHWSTKLLCTAGKAKLIKSVITLTCLYWCSVFQLPIAVINQIQKMCRDFVWGSRENMNKLHLLSWNMICRPKDEGGLGIRKLKDLQVTSQCVLAWDFLLSKDRLWISWFHHKYTTSSNFWNVIPKISHSILWKNMINVRETLLNAIHFSIGDG